MKDEELVCDNCGTTKEVNKTICPYAKEIYEEEIEVNLCDDCYYERLWEI